MVTNLNNAVHEGKNTFEGELVANGGLVVGPGGTAFGETSPSVSQWPSVVRVRVADTTERAAVVAWRNANQPISASDPLLIWRADGSLTGVNEMTLNGTDWFAESPLAGDIEMTIAATAPPGWLFLQGQTLTDAATNYPALWAAASPVFRSGGNLILPDLRGRAPIGAGQGTGLTLRNLGDITGAESVAITEAQMPTHNHSGTTGSADRSLNHTHYTAFGGTESSDELSGSERALWYNGSGINKATSTVYTRSDPDTDASLNHLHPFTTSSKGSGQAHPNVQPSLAVNFKVKV